MESRHKERKILMILMTALFTMALTVISAGISVLGGGLSQSRMLYLLNHSDYFKQQALCLEERTKQLSTEAGLPESIVAGLFLTDEILNITKEYTYNCVKGYDTELNVQAVKERLRANLYHHMEAEQMSKATIDMEALNGYLDQCASVYDQTVNHPLISYFYDTSHNDAQLLLLVIGVLALFCVACTVFIYRLTKMRRKTLSYIIRALIAAIIFTGGGAAIGLLVPFSRHLTITPAYVSDLAVLYVNGIFYMGFVMCAVLAAAIVGCIAAMRMIAHRKKKN